MPPLRLDVLAETFDDGGELAHSICEPRFDEALRDIVDSLELGWNPCLPECFADQDRSTVGLVEPECRFTQRVGTVEYAIDECLRDDDGYVVDPETLEYAMPNDDADVCVAYLGDAAGVTASVFDDLPEACDWGNLGAVIARRDHMNAPPGSTVTWTCIVSDLPAVDCPG